MTIAGKTRIHLALRLVRGVIEADAPNDPAWDKVLKNLEKAFKLIDITDNPYIDM